MSQGEDNVVPGPSNKADIQATASQQRASNKSVRWGTTTEKRMDSLQPPRRQSLMGTSGFVSQLLEQYTAVSDTEIKMDEALRKPIRKQTVEERRASVQAVGADMEYYMQEAMKPKPKSFLRKSIRSASKVLPNRAEKVEEIKSLSAMMPADSRENSKWSPSQLGQEESGTKQAVSWVGAYIVGKDYWAKKEDSGEEKDKRVGFKMDEKTVSWYEMPLGKSVRDSVFEDMRHRSIERVEAIKEEVDLDYEEKRKHRMKSAEHARQISKPSIEWDDEFELYFQDVCRSSGFSSHGHYISMTDVDKWLEKAEVLDYTNLTVMQIGLCFMASGGSRHRGLSFQEFTQFLQMISHRLGMSRKDLVQRMQACQRKPEFTFT